MARYLIGQCLPPPAFEVSEASTAEEGLSLARSNRPDVILLDLVMPGMDGREMLAELRRDPFTNDIPVIISTGIDLDAAETHALLEQATAILPKRNLTRATVPTVVRQAVERGMRLTTRTKGMT